MNEVDKMVALIGTKNGSPHYTIGYLTGMMRSLARKYPEVMGEVINTIDSIEAEAEA